MLRWFCFFLILATSGCASIGRDERRAELYLQIGTSHLEKGNYPAALKNLLEAEKHDSSNPLIQNNIGLAYFVRGQYEKAVSHIQRAIELNPNYTEATINLGRVYVEQKKYGSAERAFETATKDLTYNRPDRAWTHLGMAQFFAGEYKKAQKSLLEAIKINRRNCLAYNYFGRSQLETSQYSQAAENLDKAVVFCEGANFEEPYYFSGLSYYKLGDTDRAIARFEEVSKKFPNGQYSDNAQSLLKAIK